MSDKLKSKIMEQVRNNGIKMKSRWLFVVRGLSLKSGLGLGFVLLVLFFNAFFFYVQTNGLLAHGAGAWWQIIHSLPYDLIFLILTLLLFLNYLVRRFDFSYSHPFFIIFSSLILLAAFWASILFASNFNQTMKGALLRSKVSVPFFSDFYTRRCGMMDEGARPQGNGCMMNGLPTDDQSQ